MKSLLRLVLFAGVLTSLDSVNGMIPEAKNDQPTQTADVNDDWTQEEKDWGVNRIWDYAGHVAGEVAEGVQRGDYDLSYAMDSSFNADVVYNNKEESREVVYNLKNESNPEKNGQVSKFFIFLAAKGFVDFFKAIGDELLVPKNELANKTELRNLFTAFMSLKDDYEYFIKNLDLTKSESPFIQWLLKSPKDVQYIRDKFINRDSELPWHRSSWADFCCLQSQYSCGFKAPTKK